MKEPTRCASSGIHSCGQGFSGHLQKLTISKAEETLTWLTGPRESHLYRWRKVKLKNGGKAMLWRPQIALIAIDKDDIIFTEVQK